MVHPTIAHRTRRALLLLTLLVGALVACTPTAQTPREIRIGVVTEGSSEGGKAVLAVSQMVVERVNSEGGLAIDGQRYKLVLLTEDDQDNSELAVAAAQRLINQENVVALIGPNFSRHAIPVSLVAEDAKVPMISPSSSNPETTKDKQYIFRVGFIDPFQGRVMAHFAYEDMKVSQAAVLYDVANDYNRGIAEIFQQVYTEVGGEVVAFESYTTDQNQDFTEQLKRIQDSGAEVLFLPNFADDVILQGQQARALGLTIPLIGSDSWDPPLLSTIPELDGSYLSQNWHPDVSNEQSQAFAAEFRAFAGFEPQDGGALAYDAFGLLFEAMRRQGKTDSESIREGLASITDFQGVTGRIAYEGSGDPTKSAVVLRFEDGAPRFHKQVDP